MAKACNHCCIVAGENGRWAPSDLKIDLDFRDDGIKTFTCHCGRFGGLKENGEWARCSECGRVYRLIDGKIEEFRVRTERWRQPCGRW